MKVNTDERLPIKMWLPEGEELDDKTMGQARNLANLPPAVKWIGVMPDCHLGYGMPIGGVLVTQDAVVPNAVGVDIGCGMIAVRFRDVTADMLSMALLQAWRIATHVGVPVGMASHKEPKEIPASINLGEQDPFFDKHRDLIARQLGTLGGGNHFIELQAEDPGDVVWLMLHSGSRALGKAICDRYHKIALKYSRDWYTPLPDPDLAFLPRGAAEHAQYLAEMRFAMRFAEENRAAMLQAAVAALGDVLGYSWPAVPEIDMRIETHHNFARIENHHGANVIVHRKGAVHAKGLVTIPGSMGTASYIGEGLENPDSFATCSHGAGRVLGRKQANRTITRAQAEESMRGVVFGIRDGDFDEMPAAYKDIDAVMAAQTDLVRPVYRLRPLAVVKG